MSLHIIGASAGTGKTERLSREVAAALSPSAAERIDIEGLIAVTYTRKAEAELKARIRQTLIKQGAYEDAQRLPLAYVGTVHAICKRLVTEFALAEGLSPEVDVLPEEASERALSEALELALDDEQHRHLEQLCHRLRPNWDDQSGHHHWLPDAQDLLELARSNRIHAAELPAMAERSIAGLTRVLGPRHTDGAAIEVQLFAAVDQALRDLGDGDGTDITQKAIKLLNDALRTHETADELTWQSWLKLSTIEPAKRQGDVMRAVHEAAARHRQHPRFHDDLTEYVRLVYAVASRGLSSYSSWKEERRYIDYVDMEERALELLSRPEIAVELGSRLRLLVVDEFQDTSPIQLALFFRLEEICRRAVWVGDRKQSIFAFRGADPALMDAVVAEVERRGGAPELLATNYRSRPRLVELTSDLFARAFAPHGYDREQVLVGAQRTEDPALAALPPLGCWLWETKRVDGDALAIADGVARLLARPEATPVIDRATAEVRALRSSDIAILAATNDEAGRLARALGARGISAVVPRMRLLETPEGTMLHAALRTVADGEDRVARAHLDALTGFDGEDADRWLDRMVAARANQSWPEARGLVAVLDRQRQRLRHLAPTEAVDELIGLLTLCVHCARWPRPDERLANVEAFRTLAADYENECKVAREVGSIVGFLHFLDEAATSLYADSDRDRRDAQHAGGVEAVEINTYHRAKGLEWPVVILTSLDSESRAFGVPPDAAAARLARGGRTEIFSAVPESDAATFDARHPLAGRWLRFWPWPYGSAKKAPLADDVGGTDEAKRIADAAARESLRLLYVGFTRARDHLVLAMRATKKERKAPKLKRGEKAPVPAAEPIFEVTVHRGWLDTINDGASALLVLPTGEDDIQQARIRDVADAAGQCAARVCWLSAAPPPAAIGELAAPLWYDAAPLRERASYTVAPARAAVEWPDLALTVDVARAKVHRFNHRLSFTLGQAQMREVGVAVHRFLAADVWQSPRAERVAVAARLLADGDLGAVVAGEELVAAHDELRGWLETRWPGARWHREVPIIGKLDTPDGARQITGAIDLLLETEKGFVILDHKSYPGSSAEWIERAREHVPQLSAYRKLLMMSGGPPVIACLIHFPIGGGLVEL